MGWKEGVKEIVYRGRISVPYTWTVGEVGSRFFIELKDNKKYGEINVRGVERCLSLQEKFAVNATATLENGLRWVPKGLS